MLTLSFAVTGTVSTSLISVVILVMSGIFDITQYSKNKAIKADTNFSIGSSILQITAI
ncbi:MAG: hypothetical protein AB8U25_00310 [Rickettsiales endosymbiont of Dermacentor nuttalli]